MEFRRVLDSTDYRVQKLIGQIFSLEIRLQLPNIRNMKSIMIFKKEMELERKIFVQLELHVCMQLH